MKQVDGEFYCLDCNTTFDLVADEADGCPTCGSLQALATTEIDG